MTGFSNFLNNITIENGDFKLVELVDNNIYLPGSGLNQRMSLNEAHIFTLVSKFGKVQRMNIKTKVNSIDFNVIFDRWYK